ncbi:MAG: hypothetical protein H6719_15460 [Sandaracinaceae bacterium]|nr:hypothetical protein [Sandaracinaceae bacterium]
MRDGDNACVIELLAGGHANDASTHSALIEAYRARGQTAQAHAEMRSFIERYPTNRRARMYQQILERSGGTSSRAPSSAPRRPRAPGGRMPSNPF